MNQTINICIINLYKVLFENVNKIKKRQNKIDQYYKDKLINLTLFN